MNTAVRISDAADQSADIIANLLPGRLRKVRNDTLRKLKRELREFNIHTGEWSNG